MRFDLVYLLQGTYIQYVLKELLIWRAVCGQLCRVSRSRVQSKRVERVRSVATGPRCSAPE